MALIGFLAIWLALIFVFFVYEMRTTKLKGEGLINLLASLFSFGLGLMYSLSISFYNIAIFILACFTAITFLNGILLYYEPIFAVKSLFIEHVLYLGLACSLMLAAYNKSTLTLGWLSISGSFLFLLLNLITICYRVKLSVKQLVK